MSFLIVDEFFDFNQHPFQGKIKFKDELNGHFWGNTVRQNNYEKRNLKKGGVMFNSIWKKNSKSGWIPKDMYELQSPKQNGDFLSVHPFEAT